MKIEPTLYRFRNSEQVIIAMPGYTPPSADWGKLYTEAKMLQLGEACAALLENQKYIVLNTFKTYTPDELCRAQRENDKHAARMIRNLIKEMLPAAELAKQEKV